MKLLGVTTNGGLMGLAKFPVESKPEKVYILLHTIYEEDAAIQLGFSIKDGTIGPLSLNEGRIAIAAINYFLQSIEKKSGRKLTPEKALQKARKEFEKDQ